MSTASATAKQTVPQIPGTPTSGYAFAALGSLLFASKGIIIKLMYAVDVDTETLLALRMAFAIPIYLVIAAWTLRARAARAVPLPPRKQLVRAALVGLLGYYLASYLDFLGLVYITAHFERLILFTYPLFVMIFGAAFFGGRMTVWGIVALCISYVGLAIIFSAGISVAGNETVLGGLLVLAAALCFALYQLLAKQVINVLGSAIFTCVAMVSAGIAALLQFIIVHGSVLPALSAYALGMCALLAIAATIMPSFLLNAALARIGPQATAAIGTLSPVGTIILAVLILGEPYTLSDAVGTVLVLVGVGFYSLMDQRRAKH